MRSIPAVALVLASAAFAATPRNAFADRVSATIALGETATASVDAPGGVATVGFLVTQGDGRKLALSVTPTKKPASKLVPEVKLVAPDGTVYAFGQTGDAVTAAGAAAWKAKMPNVPQTGLWRLEIRGAGDSTGECLVSVKGVDAMSATTTPSVPPNGSYDVPIVVGENAALTISAKRTSVSKTIVPQVEILDAAGNPLDGAKLVANPKGVLKVAGYRLPVFGRYTLRLSAAGGAGGQFSLSVKSAPAKLHGPAPIAAARAVVELEPGVESDDVAGDVEPGFVGGLDATHSSDPSGGALSYRWAQVSGPKVVLSDEDTARPTFVAGPVAASLAFQLSVSSQSGESKAATVAFEVARRPVADAGRALHVATGAAVALDGGDSFDRRGAGLRYAWTQWKTDAAHATLRDATTAHPSFDAPASAALLHFSLVVDDGTARSYRDTVIVDVGGAERRLAQAGRDQYVAPMSSVYLSGLQSFATSTKVLDTGVAWTQVAGPTVALAGADTPWPSFQAPKTAADLAFQLVLDGDATVADRVTVHVRDGETNTPPTTHGNGPLVVGPGAATLSSTFSTDPTHDALLARWAQIGGAPIALATPDAATTNATIPAGAALRAFALQVNDGLAYGAPDVVIVRDPAYAGAPVAIAGPDVKIDVPGAPVVLDGRGSLRTSGIGALTYHWTQIGGRDWYDVAAKVAGFDPTAARPTFALPVTLPSLAPTRTMLFQLVVDDGARTSAPDYAVVTFGGLPSAGVPTVTAQASTTSAIVGQTVTLTGTKEDYDVDPANVTVEWIQTNNGATPVTLSPSDSVLTPTFVMPDTTAPIVFQLYGYQGTTRSSAASVQVALDRKPTASVVVTPQFGGPGTPVTFDGTGSSDPESHALTYRWSQVTPASPQLVANLTTPTISFNAPGVPVKFQLVVNDSRQDSTPVVGTFSGLLPPSVSPTAATLDTSINGQAPFAGDLKGYAAYASTVTLTANASNAGSSPTYTWRVISQQPSALPTITLSSTTDPTPTFVVPAPNATGFGSNPWPQATFGVVVHSGTGDSVEGTLTIRFFASLNNGTASQAATPSNNTVYGIVVPYCSGCHSGTQNYCPVGSGTSSGSAAGFGMATKAGFLANTRGVTSCASSKTRVPSVTVTGAASTNSYLFDRITGVATPQMPQGFSSFLPSSKTNLFKDWIDQGSLDN